MSSFADCRVHHPSVNKAAELIQRATEILKVRAYDEKDGSGQLRYIQVDRDR